MLSVRSRFRFLWVCKQCKIVVRGCTKEPTNTRRMSSGEWISISSESVDPPLHMEWVSRCQQATTAYISRWMIVHQSTWHFIVYPGNIQCIRLNETGKYVLNVGDSLRVNSINAWYACSKFSIQCVLLPLYQEWRAYVVPERYTALFPHKTNNGLGNLGKTLNMTSQQHFLAW